MSSRGEICSGLSRYRSGKAGKNPRRQAPARELVESLRLYQREDAMGTEHGSESAGCDVAG